MPSRKAKRSWIDPEPAPTVVCALCDRPLGTRVQQHHVVPKSKGGRETVPVHPICHRKIHTRFTNRELALFETLAPVKADADVARFIRWLAGKPPDFHRRTR